MAKITKFDKQNLEAIRNAFATAMTAIEQEFGVTVELNNIKFMETSFKADVSAVVKQDDPYLAGVSAKDIASLKKMVFGKCFLKPTTLEGYKDVMIPVGFQGRDKLIFRLEGKPTMPLKTVRVAEFNYDETTGQFKKFSFAFRSLADGARGFDPRRAER